MRTKILVIFCFVLSSCGDPATKGGILNKQSIETVIGYKVDSFDSDKMYYSLLPQSVYPRLEKVAGTKINKNHKYILTINCSDITFDDSGMVNEVKYIKGYRFFSYERSTSILKQPPLDFKEIEILEK